MNCKNLSHMTKFYPMCAVDLIWRGTIMLTKICIFITNASLIRRFTWCWNHFACGRFINSFRVPNHLTQLWTCLAIWNLGCLGGPWNQSVQCFRPWNHHHWWVHKYWNHGIHVSYCEKEMLLKDLERDADRGTPICVVTGFLGKGVETGCVTTLGRGVVT